MFLESQPTALAAGRGIDLPIAGFLSGSALAAGFDHELPGASARPLTHGTNFNGHIANEIGRAAFNSIVGRFQLN